MSDAISAKLVQELRERTSAGLMDCKKALVTAGGDLEAAVEILRKTGQAKADKKSGRAAAEGIIIILTSSDGKTAILIEINCETDFVAKGDQFAHFAQQVAKIALETKSGDISTLQAKPFANGQTIEEARQALIAKIGENIQIRRLVLMQAKGTLASYIHGGRIGVLVDVASGQDAIQLGKDLAMHIAASNPLVINRNQVPADIIAKEKEIFSAQAASSGKPPAIIEKMIEGRITKFLDEVSLMGQPFVKDPNMTVNQLLTQNNAKVNNFVRFAVGEGIEKQTENFVEAVMAQVRGD